MFAIEFISGINFGANKKRSANHITRDDIPIKILRAVNKRLIETGYRRGYNNGMRTSERPFEKLLQMQRIQFTFDIGEAYLRRFVFFFFCKSQESRQTSR